MKKLFKNKKVWLLSGFVIVFGVGFSAGFFYYKGQFNASFVERQSTNKTLSETDDYKIQTQIKVAERTPQSKLRAFQTVQEIHERALKKASQNKRVNKSQPPKLLTDESQPPKLLTDESQPQKLLTDESQPQKLLTDKSQPPKLLTYENDYRNTTIIFGSFNEGDFSRVSFYRSVLVGVDMEGVNFTKANFKKAKLIWPPKGSIYADQRIRKQIIPSLSGSNFSRAILQDAVIGAVDLTNVSFQNAKMQGVIFEIPKITKIRGKPNHFYVGDSNKVEFALPRNTPSRNATHPDLFKIDNTDFRGALLQGADLRNLRDLHKANLYGAKYNDRTQFPFGWSDEIAQRVGMIKVN